MISDKYMDVDRLYSSFAFREIQGWLKQGFTEQLLVIMAGIIVGLRMSISLLLTLGPGLWGFL